MESSSSAKYTAIRDLWLASVFHYGYSSFYLERIILWGISEWSWAGAILACETLGAVMASPGIVSFSVSNKLVCAQCTYHGLHRTRAAVNSHFFKIKGTGHTYLKLFRYYGAKVWNLLPTEIRPTESIENFNVKCKAYFMDKIKSNSYVKYDWSFHWTLMP